MTATEQEHYKTRIIGEALEWLGYRFGCAVSDDALGCCDEWTKAWLDVWRKAHLAKPREVVRYWLTMELSRQRAIGTGEWEAPSYTPHERARLANATARSVWQELSHEARCESDAWDMYGRRSIQRVVYHLATYWRDN